MIFRSDYDQIKAWFERERKREVDRHRIAQPNLSRHVNPVVQTLRPVRCDGRTVRLRPWILRVFPAQAWSDYSFQEILSINSLRLLKGLKAKEDSQQA